jgi:hypothetical protein
MLTVAQLATIEKELLLNLPPTLTSLEAMETRREIKKDLDQMERDGVVPELPFD